MVRKSPQKKPILNRNKVIVFLKITAACLLLFCCLIFIFSHYKMFFNDFKTKYFLSPIVLISGTSFVCFYIIMLVFHLDGSAPYLAERFDLIYKIIFSLTFVMLVIRSTLASPILNAPLEIVIPAIFSGLLTWFTPPIRDNNNTEF